MYQIKRLIAVSLIVVTMLLTNGCSATPTPALPGVNLEWEEIGYASAGEASPSGDKAGMVVATDTQEALLLKGHVGSFHIQKVLDTDFSTYFVIAVFQGYQGSDGYSIEIKEVKRDGNFITVYTRFLTPGPKDLRQQEITSPYYVLKVKKTSDLKGAFTFVLIADDKEITRQQYKIS
jgi:hypothetical protein